MGDHGRPARAATFRRAGVGELVGQSAPMHLLHDLIAKVSQSNSAFTGADHSKRGLLQTAHEGTIFLDEIGELPLFLQAKLLRALQEKEIRPVGSTEGIQIDVRVIAATNRDLDAGVRRGTFRQDLYFRLNVVQIRLPALRERKVDMGLTCWVTVRFATPRA